MVSENMASQLITKNNIVNRITLIDGVSIFFIVLYHELGGLNRSDSLFLVQYLGIFGLILFTFSSGVKMIFNHSNEISNKSFLSKYFIKRFIRLYKAYIGYTILTFIPLYCVVYLSTFYFKLNFRGISYFWDNLNLGGLFNIITGNNFVADQLWYLIALIIITFVCFGILYYFGLMTLFCFSLPLVIFDVVFWDNLIQVSNLIFKIMVYMPVYIFGIFFGYKKLYSTNKELLHIISILFAAIFLLSILDPDNILRKYDILLYGLTLSPFMFLFSAILLKNKYSKELLLRCGNYSFQIYLFHEPLILPVLSRFIIEILKMDDFITPYLITTTAIIVCIYIYKMIKKIKLNTLFE